MFCPKSPPFFKPCTMKKLLQELAHQTYLGKRTHADGSYISERRLATIQRVAEIAEEIKPGPNSEARIKAMIAKWSESLSPGTIKLYLEVCKQATKGQDYVWPSIKRDEREPTPIPIDIAKLIIMDELPESFDQAYDLDCFTACKVGINSCLRPIDAVTLTIDNVGYGEMIVTHRKTKKQVRSMLSPDVASWLSGMEEVHGNVFSSQWYQREEAYRKRLVRDFLWRLLDHYGASDRIIVAVDAGRVTRKRLRDVIVAKSLRSTGANLLLSMGVPPHDVMAIGGWSSYDIFKKHYLKANIDVWKS